MKFKELVMEETNLAIGPNNDLYKVINGVLMRQLPLGGGWVNVQQEEIDAFLISDDTTWVLV